MAEVLNEENEKERSELKCVEMKTDELHDSLNRSDGHSRKAGKVRKNIFLVFIPTQFYDEVLRNRLRECLTFFGKQIIL